MLNLRNYSASPCFPRLLPVFRCCTGSLDGLGCHSSPRWQPFFFGSRKRSSPTTWGPSGCFCLSNDSLSGDALARLCLFGYAGEIARLLGFCVTAVIVVFQLQ